MRNINEIIIHCAATKPSMDIGVDEIRDWHVNGNGWADCGYHRVIRRDGTIEQGRPLEIAGAHCYGHNGESVGICLVGGIDEDGKSENNFTDEQFDSLERLVLEFLHDFPSIKKVSGHSDYANKACPCFNVAEFLAKAGIEV